MVENVQCPVCTLFLHAGMNLSDHLETHPKEQVIKALVQMTILGGNGAASGALAAALANENKTKPEKDELVDNATDLNIASNADIMATKQEPAVPVPLSTPNDSLTFGENFSMTNPLPQKKAEEIDNNQVPKANTDAEQSSTEKLFVNYNDASAIEAYQRISKSTNSMNSHAPTDFTSFSSKRQQQQQKQQQQQQQNQQQEQLQHYQQQQNSSTSQLLKDQQITTQQHASVSLTPNSQQQQQQQRAALPPPPPPMPEQHMSNLSLGFQTLQQTQQHALLTTTTTTHRHHQHVMQHQQQHQQNLKIIYSPNLPPPPPLQLFPYSSTLQPQHHKPPPAYGTAISQIRSQHNQNKQNIAMASAVTAYNQMQQQHQQHQQQQQQQQYRGNAAHMSQTPQTATSNNKTAEKQKQELSKNPKNEMPPTQPPPLTFATAAISNQQNLTAENLTQHSQQQQQPSSNHHSSAFEKHESTALSFKLSTPPLSSQQSNTSNTNACTTTSTTGTTATRQTNSPFISMLGASVASPSVLRYAESPVAHYLERDNGDFIVQETPKHIVECVEKENGEFSVIERIYQSPPSVLHIHDEDEDEDEDEHDSNNDSNKTQNTNKDKVIPKNISHDDDDDEEFMSIASESEVEEDIVTVEKTKKRRSGKQLSNQAGETKTLSKAELNSGLNSTASNSNTSTSTTSSTNGRRKKNSITVLSDVQLNLNEYLDLVGNIIASSNKSSKRTFGATTPMPILKVEKEEPLDDDYINNDLSFQNNFKNKINASISLSTFNTTTVPATTAVPTTTTTITTKSKPPTNADKNETEKLVENNNKTSIIEIDDNPTNITQATAENFFTTTNQTKSRDPIAICSSHATSVIRMASANQPLQSSQEPTQLQQKQMPIPKKSKKYVAEILITKENNNIKNEIESVNQTPSKSVDDSRAFAAKILVHPPPLAIPPQKKGPKKLVIKPKSIKTEVNAEANLKSNINIHTSASDLIVNNENTKKSPTASDEQPTTSAMAKLILHEQKQVQQVQQQQPKLLAISDTLISKEAIKSEPTGNMCDSNSGNILEQHLISETQNLELKKEKSFSTDHISLCNPLPLTQQEHINHHESPQKPKPKTNRRDAVLLAQFKVEKSNHSDSVGCINTLDATSENVTADARVLFEFANSKKFSGKPNISTNAVSPIGTNFLSSTSIFSNNATNGSATATSSALSSAPITISSASSLCSNNSLSTSLRCEDEFIDVVQEIVISSSYSSQSASDVALNNTASAGVASNAQPNEQSQQNSQHQAFNDYPFSFLYGSGNINHDVTTAATRASGSNSNLVDDTSSDHATNTHDSRFSNPHGMMSQWYNHHSASAANHDFDTALGVDCNVAVDGDVGKYLDLDACKRENLVNVQAAPSSTSSSFTAVTESSLAGGCTTDALNIRTDERMPAKGEISEQESNCDIENSWSQPVHMDLSSRCFKSSFPGLFQQENGWNHEEYFTVQDLSTPNNNAANSINRTENKCFDFRLPLEASSSTTGFSGNNVGNHHHNSRLFPQQTDLLPTTSSANKKKRKRDPNETKKTIKRVQPTATITSQQLFLQQQGEHQHQHQHQQQQQPHQQQSQQQLQLLQQHTQQLQLNETNALALLAGPSTASAISMPVSIAGTTSAMRRKKVYQCTHCMAEFPKLKDRNSHMIIVHNYVRQNRRLISTQTSTITSIDLVAPSQQTNISTNMSMTTQNSESLEESKHGIVKIEMEQVQEQPHISMTISESMNSMNPKSESELIDFKENLSIIQPANGNPSTNDRNARDLIDKKPVLQPLSMNTTSTKLAALYRMLVSFNMSTLKQNTNLSEFEEKLISSSIFFCYVCRSNFTSVKQYDAHLTEHPAECFTCGKKFQRWKNFSLHLKRHLGWKEFGCNICDKKFVVRSALVEHMRMHTGHTPLKCKICDN
ncbi:putative mediator of RNA polymerase II transcription subunit 26 isoform X2 [Teleopsis dalmanni]|uniref:putative mediator of RNA polymerase II transcription subunit 26 isoform X2 n=1 Tax=Teleopsis dalmanni TaxID=139649 RepID=UPI0018CC7CEC|nr:putative mediator of RNA polymerase II transcription subunit 26 isoform X2 [Teleopsis dalmanni]